MKDPKDSIRFTLPNGDSRLFLDEEIFEGVFSMKKEIEKSNNDYTSINDIDDKNGISLFEVTFANNNDLNQYFAAYDNKQDNPL